MTTAKQVELAHLIADTGLVKKVFHSCQLLRDQEGIMYPAYKRGAEYIYTGIDDTKELFAYIRENGDIISTPFKLAACSKSYQMTAPFRVVYFHDSEERDFDYLIRQLTAFTFTSNVSLVKLTTDKFRLVKEESPIFREKFDGKTFYIAVDIYLNFIYTKDECETDNCNSLPNPILPCPVVVHESSSSVTS